MTSIYISAMGNYYVPLRNNNGVIHREWIQNECLVSGTWCTIMKCGCFFSKQHVKFGRIALFEVCSIACYTFSHLPHNFVNSTPVKIFPFCCESFVESFFHIFVRTEALPRKCVKSSVQTNGNWKESNPVSKPHGVELPSWLLPTCRKPVDDEVGDGAILWRKMILYCLFRFVLFLGFSQSRNGSNWSIVVGNV